jgi:hypothetical protein
MFDVLGTAAQVGFASVAAPGQFKAYREEGDSRGLSTAKAGASFFASSFLSIPGNIAVGLGIMAINPIRKGYQGFNSKVRTMNVPFSQRFEHNEMASRLQSYGLSRISEMSGMGNEAAQMYGRYGR